MNISFGIVTDGSSKHNLDLVIKSIQRLNIPKYEILVVGNTDLKLSHTLIPIPFDENLKPGWITKKKNLITDRAQYDFIVYLHDYYCFDSNWYKEVCKFGTDFDVCMHRVNNLDGTRYHDWLLWVENNSLLDNLLEITRAGLIPYHDKTFKQYMYIPGGYWFAKKEFMESYPLDESLVWGKAEDVEWSLRARKTCDYEMNPKAIVTTLKQKPRHFRETKSIEMYLFKCLKFIDILLNKMDH